MGAGLLSGASALFDERSGEVWCEGVPALVEGDLLAVGFAGAYGFVMSSNYNSRRRAAEVIVDGDDWRVARRRETVEDLVVAESSDGKGSS